MIFAAPQSGKHLRSRRSSDGFSLLELFIAVVILAVLFSLLLPAFRNMSAESKQAGCLQNMRQVFVALMAYQTDHGFMPGGPLMPTDNPTGGTTLLVPNYLQAQPYCPLMRLTDAGLNALRNGKTEKVRLGEMGSYAMNSFLLYTRINAFPGPYFGGHPYPGDHKMPVVVESYHSGVSHSMVHQDYALDGVDWGGLYVAPRDHGNKRLHFMFLDGHSALLGPKTNANGTYNWDDVFESSGRDGRYIKPRRLH